MRPPWPGAAVATADPGPELLELPDDCRRALSHGGWNMMSFGPGMTYSSVADGSSGSSTPTQL
jgi:hypothetical protein